MVSFFYWKQRTQNENKSLMLDVVGLFYLQLFSHSRCSCMSLFSITNNRKTFLLRSRLLKFSRIWEMSWSEKKIKITAWIEKNVLSFSPLSLSLCIFQKRISSEKYTHTHTERGERSTMTNFYCNILRFFVCFHKTEFCGKF